MSYEEILNDDAFARLVSEDVKNKVSSSQKQILLNPKNLERWRDALLFLTGNLVDQLRNIESDAITDAERYTDMGEVMLVQEAAVFYQNKQNKIARFKFHVDRRIDEVVSLIEKNEIPKDYSLTTPDPLVDFYRKAITTHRSLIHEYDFEETSIDRSLWAALDGRWEFPKINVDSL